MATVIAGQFTESMNVNFAQFSRKSLPHGKRHFRVLAAALTLVFLSAVPALAEPVRINQVIQTLSTSPRGPELKLDTLVTQDPGKGSTQQSGTKTDGAQGPSQPKSDTVINGVTVTQGQQIGVEIIEDGEVEGTICDCGEIWIAGGGIPKWPFLFLGAVPLVFINDCDDCDRTEVEPTPTPTPTPTPAPSPSPPTPQVPEPASLLLFGSGLAAFGAGLRRRHSRAKLVKQNKAEEEE